MLKFRAFVVAVALAAVSSSLWAAQPPTPAASAVQGPPQAARPVQTVCGLAVPEPVNLPPAGSPPVLYQVVPCFQKQGGYSVIEANTYLYYMQVTQHLSSS